MEIHHYRRGKKVVTELETYKEIRRLQLEGETSQRQAAKKLGISRNTVKKYWNGDAVPWDKKAYERDNGVLTPDVIAFINACLDEDEKVGIRKQRHTARRIYHRLIEEKEFKGGESSVRRAVHEARQDRLQKDVSIPLRYDAG